MCSKIKCASAVWGNSLEMGISLFLLDSRGSVCFSGQPYVFQTCLCLNWDGLFWEGVFSAFLPRDGLWSAQGLMLQGNAPSQPCQGKLAERCPSSSAELERGGSSRLFIPTQPPQGNSNEFALIYKTKTTFCFSRGKSSGCLGSRFQAVRYKLPSLRQWRFSFRLPVRWFGLLSQVG